jgi:hypothetical protein
MFRVTSLPPIIYRYDFTPSKHSPNKSILKVKFELSRCSRLRLLAHSFLLLYESIFNLLLLSHASMAQLSITVHPLTSCTEALRSIIILWQIFQIPNRRSSISPTVFPSLANSYNFFAFFLSALYEYIGGID